MSGDVLPSAMVISGTVSAGAVTAIDLWMNGEVDPKNVIAAYWAGAITKDMGLRGTVAVNAASGAATSYLDGKNPFLYGTISGVGSAIGYGIWNKIVASEMDNFFNPTWKTLNWDNIGMGISKPSNLNQLPSISAATSGSGAGETFNLLSDPNNQYTDK